MDGPKSPKRGRIACPKRGCPFRGDSDKAIAIHMAGKAHYGLESSGDGSGTSGSGTDHPRSHPSSDSALTSQSSLEASEGPVQHPGNARDASLSESLVQQGSEELAAVSAANESGVDISCVDGPGQGGQAMNVDDSSACSVSEGSDDASDGAESDVDVLVSSRAALALPNKFEEGLKPLLAGMSMRKIDDLLKVITDPEYTPHVIRWRSSGAFKKYMDSQNQQVKPRLYAPVCHDLCQVRRSCAALPYRSGGKKVWWRVRPARIFLYCTGLTSMSFCKSSYSIHRQALHCATVFEKYAMIMSITSALCLQHFTDLLICSADQEEPFQATLWTQTQ